MLSNGTYYVGAFSGKAKKDNRPFGKVDFIQVENGNAEVQTAFCDAEVAERAMQNLQLLDAVKAHFETRMTGRGPSARLIEVEPLAKQGKSA